MALVNEGNLAGAATEFETYLKLAPRARTPRPRRRSSRSSRSSVRFRRAPGPAGRRSRSHRARRRPGRTRPRLHPPRRRLQDVLRRPRPRRRRRRPARLRREQGPGSACRRWTQTADLAAPLAPHRPPAVEQGAARPRALRRDSLRRRARRCSSKLDEAAAARRTARRAARSRSIWPASRPSTAPRRTTLPADLRARPRAAARPGSTGLMLLPPAVDDPKQARPYFRGAAALRDELRRPGRRRRRCWRELSMGMSHDFEVADRGRRDHGAGRIGHFRRAQSLMSDPAALSNRPSTADTTQNAAASRIRDTMNVSPLDLRQQRFRTALRGFDKVEVTSFLMAVADDYEQALRETDRLRQDLARLEASLSEHREHEKSLQSHAHDRAEAGRRHQGATPRKRRGGSSARRRAARSCCSRRRRRGSKTSSAKSTG